MFQLGFNIEVSLLRIYVLANVPLYTCRQVVAVNVTVYYHRSLILEALRRSYRLFDKPAIWLEKKKKMLTVDYA